jgi:hypothetical protein
MGQGNLSPGSGLITEGNTVPRNTRSIRKNLLLAGLAALMAVPMLAPTASADVLDDGFSIVDLAAPGSNTCSTTANAPTVANKVITGTGSVQCANQQAAIALEICIEASPNGAANSFVEVTCGPTQQRQNARQIANGTHSIPCPPEPMYYRTRALGVAWANNGDMSYNGTSWSPARIIGCPVL